MDKYLITTPVAINQFVHPQDKVGPIWTGQVLQVDPAIVQQKVQQFGR